MAIDHLQDMEGINIRRDSLASLEMLRDLVSEDVARGVNVAPLVSINQRLFLGSMTPDDSNLRSNLAFILNHHVHLVARTDDQINARNDFVYGPAISTTVDKDETLTSYWGHCTWNVSETLKIKVSGGSPEGFATGTYDVPHDHADYDMWNWIITIPAYLRLIREPELKRIRRVWVRIHALRKNDL